MARRQARSNSTDDVAGMITETSGVSEEGTSMVLDTVTPSDTE
jgi:hypothetical protein